MDTVAELKSIIQDITGIKTVCNMLPDEPSELVYLRQYGGSSTPIFSFISAKKIQVNIRATSHGRCKELCSLVMRSLCNEEKAFIKLNTMDCPISISTQPIHLSTDKKNRHLYSFNISLISQN